jgi:hypothetical protein
MKRGALLILLIGAPLALILFPGFRRRLAHKLRFLLLVWSGAVLFFGLLGGPGRKSFLEGEWGWDAATLWSLFGVALFAAAFVSVLRDFRFSSLSKKSPGGAKHR